MTDTTIRRPDVLVVPFFMRELFRREPLFAGTAFGLGVLALPTLAAMALDARTLLDVSVWMKPLKFELSLMVYFGTLCWFAAYLPKGVVQTPWYRAFSIAVVACTVAEMIWLVGASANGVAAHFNTEQPVLAAVYSLMGVFAIFITSATLLYGFAIWRNRKTGLDPAVRLSVIVGLLLTFVLTLAVAPFLAGQGSHFVGGNLSDAEGMALTGWARDGGDLRVAHFFATHAMQFIPAFGLAAALVVRPRPAIIAVASFSVLFTGLVAYTFFQALAGQPFLALLI